MADITFSIVIPVFNAEAYLSECLDSVLAQSYGAYEVLLIDDGSTDRSAHICKQYRDGSSRFVYIKQRNSGALFARVAGIELARGKYCIFLDSDDALHHNTLEYLGRCITDYDPDVVLFGLFRSEKKLSLRYRYQQLRISKHSREETLDRLCSSYSLNSMCGKAIKRSLLQTGQHRIKNKLITMGEDLLQVIDIFDQAKSIVEIDAKLYFYRVNPASATSSFNMNSFESVLLVYETLRDYARKWEEEGIPNLVNKASGMSLWQMCSLFQSAAVHLGIEDFISCAKHYVYKGQFADYCHDISICSYCRKDYLFAARMLLAGRYRSAYVYFRARHVGVFVANRLGLGGLN